MFEAQDTTTCEIYAFRSLDTLTRRLGGTHFQVVHSQVVRPPTHEVHILRRVPGDTASDILTTVSVPTEAIEAAASEDIEPIF
jgi:hypothetical protein